MILFKKARKQINIIAIHWQDGLFTNNTRLNEYKSAGPTVSVGPTNHHANTKHLIYVSNDTNVENPPKIKHLNSPADI